MARHETKSEGSVRARSRPFNYNVRSLAYPRAEIGKFREKPRLFRGAFARGAMALVDWFGVALGWFAHRPKPLPRTRCRQRRLADETGPIADCRGVAIAFAAVRVVRSYSNDS